MMTFPHKGMARRCFVGAALALFSLLTAPLAHAHSSSNSYLTLSTTGPALTLRADVHLRDLDLIFDLDANRDGRVTWGETQARSPELNDWLGQGISLTAAGLKCALGRADLQASDHADGTYLSVQWVVSCPGLSSAADAADAIVAHAGCTESSTSSPYPAEDDEDDESCGVFCCEGVRAPGVALPPPTFGV